MEAGGAWKNVQVEREIPGGQGTSWCSLGAGLASRFVTRSLNVVGGKPCLPTVVREKDARLHVPGNAGSSENSTPKLSVCQAGTAESGMFQP